MAKKNDTTFFENKLLDFVTAKDPMLEKRQWVMDKLMEIHGLYYNNCIVCAWYSSL